MFNFISQCRHSRKFHFSGFALNQNIFHALSVIITEWLTKNKLTLAKHIRKTTQKQAMTLHSCAEIQLVHIWYGKIPLAE